jgi:outer membrane protein TolC
LRELQLQTLRYQRDLAQRRFDGGFSGYFEVLEIDRMLTSALQLHNQAQREQLAALERQYGRPAETAQEAQT